jgi:hypothetical protein
MPGASGLQAPLHPVLQLAVLGYYLAATGLLLQTRRGDGTVGEERQGV